MRAGRRGRPDKDPADKNPADKNPADKEADSTRLAEAAAAGEDRFRRLPARTRVEDMTTSRDEPQVPLAETDPNRDSALRWGLGGL
jgi:hypothetical protein